MARLTFHRHLDYEEPFIELVDPVIPSKRAQGKLERLGFEFHEEDGTWWQQLRFLGRRNMSCAALEKRLRGVGLDAHVLDAPDEDEFEDEDAADAGTALDDEQSDADDAGDADDGDLDETPLDDDWQDDLVADREEHSHRVDLRVYDLALRVEELEAAQKTLLAMLRPLIRDPGEPGRAILITEDEPRHIFEAQAVYFDRCRGIPVAATPEEAVRQRVLRHLEEHLGVPRHYLLSELRLPRASDRADIVVWVPEGDTKRFLAVVECKGPGTPMNDDVWSQVQRYGTRLRAPYVGITEGSVLHARRWSAETSAWFGLSGFPTFQMMLDEGGPPPSAPPRRSIPRPGYASLIDPFSLKRYDQAHAVDPEAYGGDEEHLRTLVNIASLFLDDRKGPEGLEVSGWTCVNDRGLIDTSFGNAGFSSHAYAGLYRAMILRHEEHGDVLPFFRTWTQGSGATMLALGLHHLDGRHHHAVQLNLRRALLLDHENGLAYVIHDGRMSKGGGGSFSRADVIAEVARDAPELISDGRAYLGALPIDRLITWEDAFPVLINLLRFARAADRLRTT